MKIDIPTWEETAERVEQLENTDRTIAQCAISGDKLNPIEQFIYDNEPAKEAPKWRKGLSLALENAFMCEAL